MLREPRFQNSLLSQFYPQNHSNVRNADPGFDVGSGTLSGTNTHPFSMSKVLRVARIRMQSTLAREEESHGDLGFHLYWLAVQ